MSNNKSPRIILTADDSLMLSPKSGLLSCYIPCFPENVLTRLRLNEYCRPIECHPTGEAREAPLSLRVLEAILNESGFKHGDYVTVPRWNLRRFIGEETRVIAVSTIDPRGLGPLTRTLQIFYADGEPYTKKSFELLMAEIGSLKEEYDHIRVIVGGSGAWQLASEELLERYGIDHLIIGEAEDVIPAVIESLIKEENYLPRVIRGAPADVDEIPPILDASIGGLVEASRGCGRGCLWCHSSGAGGMRCLPIETIRKSAETNVRGGVPTITLQSDDILLYGSSSKRFIPDSDAVISLFKELYSINGVESVLPLHFSVASIASSPDLLHKITAIIKDRSINMGPERFVVQVGIETGSPRVLGRYMRRKALPFSQDEWPELVKESLRVLDEEDWFCYGTIIFGFPDEDEEDIQQTIELIRGLKGLRVAIIPMVFTHLRIEESYGTNCLGGELLWKYLPLLHEIKRHNEKVAFPDAMLSRLIGL